MQFWTLILAAAALVVSAKDAKRHHKSSSSSSSSDPSWTTLSSSSEERTSVKVGVDNGYYAFTYGNEGTLAFQSFIVESRHLTILSVSDCFLPGDVFQIYDNGQFMMVTDLCSAGPIPDPSSCTVQGNPCACFADSRYCKNFGYLLPGFHNISIAVVRSAATAGAGYLRVDSACENECVGSSCPIFPQPCCMIPGNQACSKNISPYGFTDGLNIECPP
jgi:hypothetical protein